MYPSDFGNSTSTVSEPLSEVAPAVETLDRLLAALEYRGVFSAEFKRDERDGRFKLLEVNCRHWWYVEFAAACGVDVSLMSYRDALGLPVTPVEGYEVGRRCVYPYFDRYPCWEMLRAGRLSPWAWARSWIGAEQPIYTRDDPWPAVADLRALTSRFLRTRLHS
jgi:predicted ATP-grasp superfamily ATP-dependent carboligase